MEFQQAITNTTAKKCSSAEANRWRAQGVDPELLGPPPIIQLSELAVREAVVIDLTGVQEADQNISSKV